MFINSLIMKRFIALVLLVTFILNISAQGLYKKIIHNTDPQAKCLDGSPGLIYVHEGGDTKNILIFFLGGGLCGETTLEGTLQSCYQRSFSIFGSSVYWPDQMPNQLIQGGYMSTNPNQSAFANWTKFFLPYCDGTVHQGYSDQPIQYKDTSLYFRGGALTRSNLNWINAKYDLKGAQKVVLTGISAGGVATNSWNNYVRDLAGDASKVYPISDSGIFINFKAFTGQYLLAQQLQNMYKVANNQEKSPLQECNKHYIGQEWKCLLMQYSYPFIQGDKYMIVNSQYDSWALQNFTKVGCLKQGKSGFTLSGCNQTQMEYIETYRTEYKLILAKVMAAKPEINVWSISCSNHVYTFFKEFYNSPLQKIPTTVGKTVRDVVEDFVIKGATNVVIDSANWPDNTACAM